MQGLLPAGWLAFTERESNSLDRYKRFQIIILLLFWTWPGAREVSFLNLPLASHHSITASARMEIEAMFVYGRRGQSASPLPVALVEGRRRAQPGTPDTLGARKAKVLHQVNQALA